MHIFCSESPVQSFLKRNFDSYHLESPLRGIDKEFNMLRNDMEQLLYLGVNLLGMFNSRASYVSVYKQLAFNATSMTVSDKSSVITT